MSATCGLKCVWYPVGYRWRIFQTTMQLQPDSVNYFGHLYATACSSKYCVMTVILTQTIDLLMISFSKYTTNYKK